MNTHTFHYPLHTVYRLLTLFVLIISVSTARSQSCSPLLPSDTEAISTYLSRQFELPSGSSPSITAVDFVGTSCYRRLTVAGIRPNTLTTVYLTADKKYLTSALADVASDPRALRRTEQNRTNSKLADAATPLDKPTASVTIYEFVDYQCPYCKRFSSWVDALPPSERDRLAVRYINLPLPMHSWARTAALYSICLGDKPLYLSELRDLLFSNQEHITQSSLDSLIGTTFASKFPNLTACAESPETTAKLNSQIALASELHISGTPVFFQNGHRILIPTADALLSIVAPSAPTRTTEASAGPSSATTDSVPR